jgi:hypothetical protein
MRMLITIVSLCVLFLTGCSDEKEAAPTNTIETKQTTNETKANDKKSEPAKETDKKKEPTSEVKEKAKKKEPIVENPKEPKGKTLYTTYKDSKYPFQLSFPADLGKIKVTNAKLGDDPDYAAQFYVPIQGQDSLIFSVLAIPTGKETTYKDTPAYLFVGKNSTHYFFIIKASEAPDAFYQAQNAMLLEQWQRVMEDHVPSIIKSFKLGTPSS